MTKLSKTSKTSKTSALSPSNRVSRALSRVSTEPTESGCLIWKGRCLADGNGGALFDRSVVATHRLSWAHGLAGDRHGALPPSHVEIRHLCGRRRCNNPAHLSAATAASSAQPPAGSSRRPRPGRPRKSTTASALPTTLITFERRASGVSGCLIWEDATESCPWGRHLHLGEPVLVHRLAWAFGLNNERHGALPPSHLFIKSVCGVPGCVNPEHLYAAKAKDRPKGNGHQRGDAHYSRRRPELTARGEAASNARLTDAEVVKIFSLRAEGWTLQELAVWFGCSKQNISLILLGRTRVPFTSKKPA